MNGLVLFIFLVGAAVGYAFARIQLRGRFLLALEGRETPPLPGPWCPPDEAPLSHAWNPPPQPSASLRDHPGLIRTPLAPQGFTAKHIVGRYDPHGFERDPLYPGGLNGWLRDNGLPYREPALDE
jgi:hypothetical protein